MLPNVASAAASGGGRALLLLTLASAVHSGESDMRTRAPAPRRHLARHPLGLVPAARLAWRHPSSDNVRAMLPLGAGVDNPCTHTADGFLRPRSPCGVNGTCLQLIGVPAEVAGGANVQHAFNCTCHGNYAGDRCERCTHGNVFRSGCMGESAACSICQTRNGANFCFGQRAHPA